MENARITNQKNKTFPFSSWAVNFYSPFQDIYNLTSTTPPQATSSSNRAVKVVINNYKCLKFICLSISWSVFISPFFHSRARLFSWTFASANAKEPQNIYDTLRIQFGEKSRKRFLPFFPPTKQKQRKCLCSIYDFFLSFNFNYRSTATA